MKLYKYYIYFYVFKYLLVIICQTFTSGVWVPVIVKYKFYLGYPESYIRNSIAKTNAERDRDIFHLTLRPQTTSIST